MMDSWRALTLNAKAGEPMPNIPEMRDVYELGWVPRRGEMTMIAGRSGAQKSGLAMWIVEKWGLPTLYFSGDMGPFTASSRIASMKTGRKVTEIERVLKEGTDEDREIIRQGMADSAISWRFGPITYRGIDRGINSFIEMHNAYPEVIVIDNLMDVAGAEAEYDAQMEVMQELSAIKTQLNTNVLVTHHATDKKWDTQNPWKPPSRDEIKGGMSEKPECILTVGLDPIPMTLNVAIVKQRSGAQNATGGNMATLWCDAEHTRFDVHENNPYNRRSLT